MNTPDAIGNQFNLDLRKILGKALDPGPSNVRAKPADRLD